MISQVSPKEKSAEADISSCPNWHGVNLNDSMTSIYSHLTSVQSEGRQKRKRFPTPPNVTQTQSIIKFRKCGVTTAAAATTTKRKQNKNQRSGRRSVWPVGLQPDDFSACRHHQPATPSSPPPPAPREQSLPMSYLSVLGVWLRSGDSASGVSTIDWHPVSAAVDFYCQSNGLLRVERCVVYWQYCVKRIETRWHCQGSMVPYFCEFTRPPHFPLPLRYPLRDSFSRSLSHWATHSLSSTHSLTHSLGSVDQSIGKSIWKQSTI